jgi:hypothetical protein
VTRVQVGTPGRANPVPPRREGGGEVRGRVGVMRVRRTRRVRELGSRSPRKGIVTPILPWSVRSLGSRAWWLGCRMMSARSKEEGRFGCDFPTDSTTRGPERVADRNRSGEVN